MSRGPGRTERAIIGLLASWQQAMPATEAQIRRSDGGWREFGRPVGLTITELAREVYDVDEPSPSQKRTVRRAVDALAAKYSDIQVNYGTIGIRENDDFKTTPITGLSVYLLPGGSGPADRNDKAMAGIRHQARDMASEAYGLSRRSMERQKYALEIIPEQHAAMKAGVMSINQAYNAALVEASKRGGA